MSRPFCAAIGFTASRIWACGPGVAPIRRVCVCAAAGRLAARDRRAASPNFFNDTVDTPWIEWENEPSRVAQTLVESVGEAVSDALDSLDENDQNEHDRRHHIGHEALVAVADSKIAEPAAA